MADQVLGLALAPIRAGRQSSRRMTARVTRAFVREERFGIRIATYARLVALVVIGVWVAVQNWNSGATMVAFYLGTVAAFAALGLGHLFLSESRFRRPWHKYAFVTLELALLLFILIQPPPGIPTQPPAAMRLRWGNELYFFVLMASTALTFSPLLVLWFGVAATIMLSIAVTLISQQPGSFGFGYFADPTDDPSIWLPIVLDPNYVNPNLFVTQLVTLLVASGTLSLAVWRARLLVCRQAEAERERTNLARYFSPNLVEELAQADEPLGAARAQNAAILFADIVGFTRLTESMAPEHTLALLRDFHRRMAEAVFAHGGTLDKYIGDEVMATFGTPRPGPRDASNAIACARAMQIAISAWNGERTGRGDAPVQLGIGVHFGPVVLGDIGGEQRFEFAVIGDTVNVASRLERLTRQLGVGIVASDALVKASEGELGRQAAQHLEGFTPEAEQAVRGRDGRVGIWTFGGPGLLS